MPDSATSQSPYIDDGIDIASESPAPPKPPLSRPVRALIGLLLTALAFAGIVTAVSALTSPPEGSVPVGHLIYMDSDQPSEKTAMLRGMFLVGPGNRQTLITHEQEPQDVDAGAREWINEPTASPDGRRVAYVKQLITILDEKQADDCQLWVAGIDGSLPTQGRMIYDLTANHLDFIKGLAWTPDGKSISFLEGGLLYTIPVDTPVSPPMPPGVPQPGPDTRQVPGADGRIGSTPDQTGRNVSDTDIVALLPDLDPVYLDDRDHIVWTPNNQSFPDSYVFKGSLPAQSVRAAAVSVNGKLAAYVDNADMIHVVSSKGSALYRPKFGWSMFGGRHVTSLHWSPDARYLGYTVSKPPISEAEMYYLDVSTGLCYKLPLRTGAASWDWTR